MAKQSSMWDRTKNPQPVEGKKSESKPRVLILGCGGMDGSYMAEHCLAHGWEIHGLHRKSSLGNLQRIEHIRDKLVLHRGDMADALSIDRTVRDVRPEWVVNLADQDCVRWSSVIPDYSADISYGAVSRLLETVRQTDRGIKVFQPVSATMFGEAPPPQNEETPLDPRSPYAIAKTAAYHLCRHYRREYGMLVYTGIMFNHDSPRRGEGYLLGKICAHATGWTPAGHLTDAARKHNPLVVGSLEAKVDIGHADDYMEAAYRIMELDTPGDWVIGTGRGTKIIDLITMAYDAAGVSYETLEGMVEERPSVPPRNDVLIAAPLRIRKDTGWVATTPIRSLIKDIVDMYSQR